MFHLVILDPVCLSYVMSTFELYILSTVEQKTCHLPTGNSTVEAIYD